MNQMDLTDIYRALHPKIKEYNFFWVLHVNIWQTENIINHETSVNIYKIAVIPCILPDDYRLMLETEGIKKLSDPTTKAYSQQN